MATHRFQPTHYHTTIGPHKPVLHIADGDTIITTTVDAGGHDASGEQVTPADYIFSVGNARPLDQAVQHATSDMGNWLLDEYGLDMRGASILVGLCGEYDVGNVFDPAYTMACKVPKRFLPACR